MGYLLFLIAGRLGTSPGVVQIVALVAIYGLACFLNPSDFADALGAGLFFGVSVIVIGVSRLINRDWFRPINTREPK